MGFREKHWAAACTITAAAGVSLVAWKVYRQRGRHKQLLYSLAYAGSRRSLPPLHDHTLSGIKTPGAKYPKVYSIGGHGSGSQHVEVWLLDSALNAWDEVSYPADNKGNMIVKRSCHASAGVGNAIYVIGGYTSKTVDDVLKFDTVKEQWSIPSFSGAMPSPRSSHSATVVGKKVYVFGGYGDSSALNDVHILDTVTGSWSTPAVLGVPPAPRCAHSALYLARGDRIVVYGGFSHVAEGDIWCLEVDTPYVRTQKELLGKEVVAWSKGSVGETPQPAVICGPSGVGKGTLIAKLMEEFPNEFGFSVSHTTRSPRTLEQDGVHYYFTSHAEMQREIREGKFLESAHVHGNLYGTSIAAVEAVTDAGKRCILDIDVQGAELVRKSPLNALFIFISPPTFQELETRLRGRGTETEEHIHKRLKNARKEVERCSDHTLFDHLVINDTIDDAYRQLKIILGCGASASASANGLHRNKELQPEARSGHSSCLFGSKVLIYGGATNRGKVSNDIWLLDTSRLTSGAPGMTRGFSWSQAERNFDFWKYLNLAATLSPRYNHRVVPLSATEMLVTGGYDGKQALSESIILKLEEE